MKSILVLFVIGWTVAIVNGTTQLGVTCNIAADGDLTISVALANWGSYTSLHIVGETSSVQAITSGTLSYDINLTDLSIAIGAAFTLQATEDSGYLSSTDISEDWTCVRDTSATSATETLTAQAVDGPDNTDSVTPTFDLAIKLQSDGNVVSSPVTIGTSLKLAMTLDSKFQSIYFFRVDDVEIRPASGVWASLYASSKCTAKSSIMGNPSLKGSAATIDMPFDAFRIITATYSNDVQPIEFKVTVTPCSDLATCESTACASSPSSAATRRRKRSAAQETSAEMNSTSSETLYIVQPPGTEPSDLTKNGKGTDDVLKGDGLCFGRTPVYAGAAIFMAILIAVSCFGFYLVLMSRRRRDRKRLVESPSTAQSVMSVQCGHHCGKPHFQG